MPGSPHLLLLPASSFKVWVPGSHAQMPASVRLGRCLKQTKDSGWSEILALSNSLYAEIGQTVA